VKKASSIDVPQLTLFANPEPPAQRPTHLPHPRVQSSGLAAVKRLAAEIQELPLDEAVKLLNEARSILHDVSPFKTEPVDCVLWEPCSKVYANDYNPNVVAPPEMELLAHSILTDGYTQPIVTFPTDDGREVVDGFHRSRVGQENPQVKGRVSGYLPVVAIKADQSGLNDRIAATIRHNRARGKHKVDAMSDIVVELKRRNWTGERIARELGMDQDEVLRLCQITGLAELFSDQEFSASWDVEGEVSEADFEELTDDPETIQETAGETRVVNTSDENRIFHTYEKWECYAAGFYATTMPGMRKDECEREYRDFLADIPRFKAALQGVLSEWKHSCEHYLTNSAMNRIAWLGQAAMCYATSIPAVYRSGFFLLTPLEQEAANQAALEALNQWLLGNDREPLTMEQAYSGRQSDIY
jgi:ParB-like chromosome segregation protein Spo0J